MIAALVFHTNDSPILECLEGIGDDWSDGNIRLSLGERRPLFAGQKEIGRVVELEVFNKQKNRPWWKGLVVSVHNGVKKGEALAVLGLSRNEVMYLALASRHAAWIMQIFVKPPEDIAYWICPPKSNDLLLNDFPHVFLFNDFRSDFHFASRVVVFRLKLAEALIASRGWRRPRPRRLVDETILERGM